MASAPLDSEQLLFAVDIVKYFLKKHHRHLLPDFVKTDIAKTVEGYRSGLKERFTANIPKIIDEIDATVTNAVSQQFSQIKNKDIASLEKYITKLKGNLLPEGFRASAYLVFSVQVCLMSCLFQLNLCDNALNLAVERIESAFPDNKDEAKRIWKDMRIASNSYKSSTETVVLANERREVAEIQSGTDESSNSSTTNSESDSSSESKNVSEGSSEESLNELIMRLNSSVVEGAKDVKPKGNVTSAPSTECEITIDHKENVTTSSTLLTVAFEKLENVIAAAFVSTEDENKVESKESESTLTTDNGDNDENKENASATLSAECAAGESKQSSTDHASLEGAVQSPSVTSSISKMPTCEFDFGAKIKTQLEGQEDASLQLPGKSPTKSFLGKRPSPRKEISLRAAVDNSEIEIKKPKLEFPEKEDE